MKVEMVNIRPLVDSKSSSAWFTNGGWTYEQEGILYEMENLLYEGFISTLVSPELTPLIKVKQQPLLVKSSIIKNLVTTKLAKIFSSSKKSVNRLEVDMDKPKIEIKTQKENIRIEKKPIAVSSEKTSIATNSDKPQIKIE